MWSGINSRSVILSGGDLGNSVAVCDTETAALLESQYAQKLKFTAQKILNICGSIIITTSLLSTSQCMLKEDQGKIHFISGFFAAAGLSCILLETLTSKLIINGGYRMGYILCILKLLDQEDYRCPGVGDIYAMGAINRTQEWLERVKTVQGAILITCTVQFLIGKIGIHRLAMFVRPIAIAPTMLLIGASIFKTTALTMASTSWILFFVSVSLISFSYSMYASYRQHTIVQNADCIKVPNIRRNLYIGVLCLLVIWTLSVAFSSMGFRIDGGASGIDIIATLKNSYAVALMYPFKWGWPKWQIDSVLLVLPASFVSIFEVLAAYHDRCASEREEGCDAKKQKRDNAAWSSIICWEAAFGLLNVTMGSALGITISFKKENQTYVGWMVGVILVLIALYGSLCSLLVIIPEPIVSALTCFCFISLLLEGANVAQRISFGLKRNVYIFGSSICLGLVIPVLVGGEFVPTNQRTLVGHVLVSLLSMEFVVAGLVAVILDNLSRVLSPEKFVLPVNFQYQSAEEKIQTKDISCYDCLGSLFM